ncbi:glycosyltransferase [Anaeromyxobacter oryzae]|uniref:Glycosyl transferase n=1 Tax=Anaeromyxobacter oryzae TaxID=2918170 RepID=A0ABN6N1I0_9BACT|nr:glycosyltransferase [Anaeromyxobacter oryzae]BDG05820.1 glycosyl transferase [Anaeromyxobacter oryzae]
MRTSIVVLTYERPDALALALRGLARQSVAPDEVIITDDGSSPATRACVVREARGFPCPVVFLTHDRGGPRMSRARNRGIAAARGDYVIFLDGDQVPSRHFVADHRAFARPGTFVQGSRALASAETTARLLAGGDLDVSPLEPGLGRRRHALRAPALWWLFARRHRSRRGLKSCNFAFWRDDLVRLNGFDEEMTGWGLEDGELAQRGYHLGLWRRDLRLGGGVLHLWHGPPGVLRDDNPNWLIYDATIASRRVRCTRGLDAHLAELAGPLPDLREEADQAASPR